MKRSAFVKLGLMASTAIALSACGEPTVEGRSYRSAEACVADDQFTDSECIAAYNTAMEIHDTSAPRYETRSLCEDEFGRNNCTSPSSSFWSPFMTGYFVGNALDGLTGMRHRTRPLYYTNGRWYTASGTSVIFTSDGRTRVGESTLKKPPKAAKVQTRTSVIARGGFGSRSSSRSSWGG